MGLSDGRLRSRGIVGAGGGGREEEEGRGRDERSNKAEDTSPVEHAPLPWQTVKRKGGGREEEGRRRRREEEG